MDVTHGACYFDRVVTVRHILLAVGGLVVIAAAIYLAIEVRATPAAAQVATRSQPAPAKPAPDDTEPAAPQADRAPSVRTTAIPTAAQISKQADASSATTPAPAIDGAAKEPMDDAKLKQVITDAYAAYDRQEFEDAKAFATRALSHDPKNVRALRIMVSTSCIDGNAVEAQKFFDQLPEGKDRADMRTRCGRDYNITFK